MHNVPRPVADWALHSKSMMRHPIRLRAPGYDVSSTWIAATERARARQAINPRLAEPSDEFSLSGNTKQSIASPSAKQVTGSKTQEFANKATVPRTGSRGCSATAGTCNARGGNTEGLAISISTGQTY